MTEPIIALDVPSAADAMAIVAALGALCSYYKVGTELFTAAGPDVVRRLMGAGKKIFLDLKLHDIPNTVAKAMEALAPLEPAILTVHAGGGREMLAAAKRAAPAMTKVVAVTLLTSLDDADLGDLGMNGSSADQVERLATLAREAGVDGIVCSGAEIAQVKAAWPDGFFVVPGVRPAAGDFGDQKRVITPLRALENGASILVIGRPITGAADPVKAIMEIEAGLSHMPAEARI